MDSHTIAYILRLQILESVCKFQKRTLIRTTFESLNPAYRRQSIPNV